MLSLQRSVGNRAVATLLADPRRPVLPPVQRDDPKAKSAYATVGVLTFFDSSGDPVGGRWRVKLMESTMAGGRPATGVYDTTVKKVGKNQYVLGFGSHKADVKVKGAAPPRGFARALLQVSASGDLRSQSKAPTKKPGGKSPGNTSPDGKSKGGSGSKYGWLGLISLPQSVIDVLEKAFEALVDAEEYLALKKTLQELAGLADQAGAIDDLFDADRLLLILLGLESNPALDSLEGWVTTAPPARRTKPARRKKKGLIGLARAVTSLLAKVRRMLGPVFATRETFNNAIALVALGMREIEAVADLVAVAQDPKRASKKLDHLLAEVATEMGSDVQGRLEMALGMVDLVVEGLSEADDLITRKQIASAVLDAVVRLVPKVYKPFVYVARESGLLELVADNFVSELIPEAALDAANGVCSQLGKALEPALTGARRDLDKVVSASGEAVSANLVPQLQKVITGLQASKPAAAAPGSGVNRSHQPMPQEGSGARAGTGRTRAHATRRGPGGTTPRAARGLADRVSSTERTWVGDRIEEIPPATRARTPGPRVPRPGRAPPDPPRGGDLVVQGSWDTAVTALKKKVGTLAADRLTSLARPGSRKEAAQAEQILKEVKALIGKRVNKSLRLPSAYHYRRRKGRIVGIARRRRWAGSAIPKLAVEKGRVTLGTRWNWKDAARAKLRRNLPKKKDKTAEAHHLIPLTVSTHRIVRLATKKGSFDVNGPKNGIWVPHAVHGTGGHRQYNAKVRDELVAIDAAVGSSDWTKVEPLFNELLRRLRQRVQRRITQGKPLL